MQEDYYPEYYNCAFTGIFDGNDIQVTETTFQNLWDSSEMIKIKLMELLRQKVLEASGHKGWCYYTMELKIVQKHVIEEKIETYNKTLEDIDILLMDFIHPMGMVSVFDKYYIDDCGLMLNDIFPYVIRRGSIYWNVPYSEVTVREFLDTHPQCLNEGIEIVIGLPAAGGPGYIFGKAAVQIIVSALCIMNPIAGFTCDALFVIGQAIAELSDYYEAKEISPIQQLSALINIGTAGTIAIQEILEYDEYHANKLLMSLGFEKDIVSGKYIISEKKRIKARKMLEGLSIQELKYID